VIDKHELNQLAATLERRVIERTADLETASLAKSRFLAAASHDLRQPMHAINLYLATLAGFELSASASDLLAKARQCGRTMDEMFRALLDMSRLDASAVQPEICVFSVAPVLERIRVQFEPQACAKGLELRIVPCAGVVRCDISMVERILRNLVANSVHYTEHGKILVGCRRRGSRLRLAVYDTGPGIPPGKHRAIFEEFFQLGNPERDRRKGLGLGLAIVERLARLLEVPITLTSSPGQGSVFAIDVPRSGEAARPLPPVVPIMASSDHPLDLLIGVIDDEVEILDATRVLLEQWGCNVITATGGAEAIERLNAGPRAPDVLICDYRLRGEENGLTVIAAVRQAFNQDIPVLLITGDTAAERIREIETSDFPVLHKPIEEQALMNALVRLIEQRVSI
jgi:CheY-like chemotaxis protein